MKWKIYKQIKCYDAEFQGNGLLGVDVRDVPSF